MQPEDFVVVLVTAGSVEEGGRIGRALVEDRLAACVNLVPGVHSIYRWQGRVEAADEILLVIKTTSARVEALSQRITALHSYDVPEVIVVKPAGGAAPYLAWLAAAVMDDG